MTFSPSKALACTLAAAILAGALPAEAGERWPDHHRRPAPAEQRHSDAAGLLAAGLIGLAAGAIIAGIASQTPPAPREPAWRHPQAHPRPSPDRVYFPPAPPRGTAGLHRPWSPAWRAR